MKMRVNICGCLLAFALGCNVTAEIIHEVFEEKASISLRCPHSVEGKVTWSREINGNKVDIFTVDGDREMRHNDPGRRYGSEADKTLHIRRVTVSDTGRYFCNNEPAVELTVIPSGTVRLTATERTSVTLKCPPDVGGSDVPTWSRDTGEIQQQRRFYVSPVDKTLTIADVQPGDSGLYYCDGKPAVYLNVTKGNKAIATSKLTTPNTPSARQTEARTTSTAAAPPPAAISVSLTPTPANTDTTTTKKQSHNKKPGGKNDKDKKPPLGLVFGIVVPFLILLLIIIYFTWRCRFKKQGCEERYPVYDEIEDGLEFQPTKGIDAYYMPDVSDGSNENEPTYSTIPDLVTSGKEDW
ncbi:uncharacterized protein LOC122864861 isoform X2 [Siniperca chuatsi]|uniref:uncharacterized protein LOC122864861 isoform X2 n=1 Tax=Siniperca chuatsi TaxID=119488 RepID=UPI001CE128AB|nr:uncharacterized protein LOC122864861 isoform X2 [Siniperca chuatsi]